MRFSFCPAVLAGLLAILSAGEAKSEESFLAVSITETTIDVGGVTPGGAVALLGADRQRSPESEVIAQVTIVELLNDEDGDGSVAPDRSTVVSQASAWLAVELESGRGGSATRWGEPISPFASPLGLARPIETGLAVVAANDHDQIQLLLIRPGVGAWTALGVDGGLSEETGVANGRVTFYEPAWEALTGDEAGPGERLASDLLVALDPALFTSDARRSGDLTWLP